MNEVLFLETVVREIVENKDAVKVDRTVDDMGVMLNLSVHASDMGRIIGKEGSTAKALRTLLRVVGMQNNARVSLRINEPDGGKRSSNPFGSDDNFGL